MRVSVLVFVVLAACAALGARGHVLQLFSADGTANG